MRVTRLRIGFPTALAGALLLSVFGNSTSAAQNASSGTSSRSAPLSSEAVCTLIGAGEVKAILGVGPNATPITGPASPGAAQGQCRWDAGSGKGDLTLTVNQGLDEMSRMLIANTPIEGDAIKGIGDQAGLVTQGTYSVEVMVRVGPRLLTVSASAMGVTAKKDAVVTAARTAAAKLR